MKINLDEIEGIYLDFLGVYEAATKVMHTCGGRGNPIQYINDLLRDSGSDLFLESPNFLGTLDPVKQDFEFNKKQNARKYNPIKWDF